MSRARKEPIRFDGQVAIVTGAGNGLGRAYATELATLGAAVVCNDVDADAARATAEAIRARGGTAVAESSTVATPEGGAAVVDSAIEGFGSLEIVINNAGQLRNAAFDEMTVDDFDAVIATHLSGAFYVTQPAYRQMRAAGYGRVVFTSSAARFASPWQANYAAAKSGVVGLCKVVASEGSAHGIMANAVMPMALTAIGRSGPPPFAPDDLAETIAALAPLAPYLTADNVTPAVLYLAGRGCECTGRVLSVGAGRVADSFVGVTRGWYAPDPAGMTPADVGANLAVVCDRADFVVPESMNDESRFIAAGLPGAPGAGGDEAGGSERSP